MQQPNLDLYMVNALAEWASPFGDVMTHQVIVTNTTFRSNMIEARCTLFSHELAHLSSRLKSAFEHIE